MRISRIPEGPATISDIIPTTHRSRIFSPITYEVPIKSTPKGDRKLSPEAVL
jgi:hypothetical protein